ncbi:MAG TPA: Hpt domain-containing protein, partial [Allocoleopsis sp.]
MSLDPEIREQTYQYFLQEAPELLNDLEQGLLNFRTDRGINQVNNLMRVTHTLKGAATSVGLETIATIAHSLEDIFKALCQPNLVLQPDAEALLFEGVECLRLPLIAELTGGVVNHTEILDRAATIFAQLQEQLGDCFDQVAQLPTSAELGFDVILSIFELGVEQRLEKISLALEDAQPEAIAATLQTQAEVFLGLAESLNLPGFGAIASLVLTALTHHPDQAKTIAEVALADLRAGQAAVLAGDRIYGGQASERLQHLAKVDFSDSHLVTPVTPVIPLTPVATLAVDSSEEQPINALLDHIWGGQAIDPGLDTSVLDTSVLDTSVLDTSSLDSSNLETVALNTTNLDPNLDVTNLDVTNLDVTNLDVTNLDATLDVTNLDALDATNLDILNLEITDLDSPVDTEGGKTLSEKSASITRTDLSPFLIQDAKEPIYSVSPSPIPPPSSKRRRDPVAPAPQIRVHVQYLDQLNNAIGELITQQNRQFLQAEQLQSTVKTLFTRLKQHQQLLYQLRQQSKRSQNWLEKRHNRTERKKTKKAKSVGKSARQPASNPIVPHSITPHTLPANSVSPDFSTQLQTLLDDMVQLMEAADA